MKKEFHTFGQIARLRHLLRKWQARALAHTETLSPRFPKNNRSPFVYDSDEEEKDFSSSPADVPEGFLAVYVGSERRRFIIPTGYLGRPLFRPLLDKAEEEFGFDHQGALTIPCEVSVFKLVLGLLEEEDSAGQIVRCEETVGKYCTAQRDCASSSTAAVN